MKIKWILLVLVVGAVLFSGCALLDGDPNIEVPRGEMRYKLNPEWKYGDVYADRYSQIWNEEEDVEEDKDVHGGAYLVVKPEWVAINVYEPSIVYGSGSYPNIPAADAISYPLGVVTVRILANELKGEKTACQSDFCDGTLDGMTVSNGTPFIIDLDMDLTLNLDGWDETTFYEKGEIFVRAGDLNQILTKMMRHLRQQRDLIVGETAYDTYTHTNWDSIEGKFITEIDAWDEDNLFTVVSLGLRRTDPPEAVATQFASAAATDTARDQQLEDLRVNADATRIAAEYEVTQEALAQERFVVQATATAQVSEFVNKQCFERLQMRAEALGIIVEKIGQNGSFWAVQQAVDNVIPPDICDN